MKFGVLYQQTAHNACSPIRVIEQTTGRAVGWINRYLDVFAVQVTIDPADRSAGGLLDNTNRTTCVVGGLLVEHTELHGRAASSRDWNCPRLPPWTKKEFG